MAGLPLLVVGWSLASRTRRWRVGSRRSLRYAALRVARVSEERSVRAKLAPSLCSSRVRAGIRSTSMASRSTARSWRRRRSPGRRSVLSVVGRDMGSPFGCGVSSEYGHRRTTPLSWAGCYGRRPLRRMRGGHWRTTGRALPQRRSRTTAAGNAEAHRRETAGSRCGLNATPGPQTRMDARSSACSGRSRAAPRARPPSRRRSPTRRARSRSPET